MAMALHHSQATGAARLVLIGIANHDGDGGAFPAMATLAKYAHINLRNARNAVRRLEQLGEIRTVTNGGALPDRPTIYQPNRYEVLVRCPYFCDGTKNHRDTRHALISEVASDLSEEPREVAGGITEGSLATYKPSFNPSPTLKKKTQVNSGQVIHRYAASGWCENCERTPHKREENAA